MTLETASHTDPLSVFVTPQTDLGLRDGLHAPAGNDPAENLARNPAHDQGDDPGDGHSGDHSGDSGGGFSDARLSDRGRDQERRRRRAAHLTGLFTALAEATDDASQRSLRDDITVITLPLAESFASRYRNRGVDYDDLVGVAQLALVKSINRFDVASGHDFYSFAVPTIRGEIRRYFRDNGWVIRPPRRIQELQARLHGIEGSLSARLNRPPTPADLAAAVGVPLSEVVEAQAAYGCFSPTSTNQPVGQDGTLLEDLLGGLDEGYDHVEVCGLLGPAVRTLTERERRILGLRFYDQLTQQEIAEEIGVTQMQVSRLLTRILRRLKGAVEAVPQPVQPQPV